MKQDFSDDMLHDGTTSETQITTPEQEEKTLDLEDRDVEDQDALVKIESTRTQVMGIEAFIEILRNKAQSIVNIDEQVDKIEEGIEEYYEAYPEAMDTMERLDKENSERGVVKPNTLTKHHMEAYKTIQEDKQQVEDLKNQRENVVQSIKDMWNVASQLFDEGQPVPQMLRKLDEFDTSEWETEEPEQEEIETEDEEEEEE